MEVYLFWAWVCSERSTKTAGTNTLFMLSMQKWIRQRWRCPMEIKANLVDIDRREIYPVKVVV
ncbi:MAG: hypothetical protein WBG65_13600, partial [Sulfurimonadaceae bacterium]